MAATLHECPVEGCDTRVPTRLLMCRAHWYLVSPDLRDEVYIMLHRFGVYSDQLLEAQKTAIAAAEAADRDVVAELATRKAGKDGKG